MPACAIARGHRPAEPGNQKEGIVACRRPPGRTLFGASHLPPLRAALFRREGANPVCAANVHPLLQGCKSGETLGPLPLAVSRSGYASRHHLGTFATTSPTRWVFPRDTRKQPSGNSAPDWYQVRKRGASPLAVATQLHDLTSKDTSDRLMGAASLPVAAGPLTPGNAGAANHHSHSAAGQYAAELPNDLATATEPQPKARHQQRFSGYCE